MDGSFEAAPGTPPVEDEVAYDRASDGVGWRDDEAGVVVGRPASKLVRPCTSETVNLGE